MNETFKYENFMVTINPVLPEEFDEPEDAEDCTLCHVRIYHHDKLEYDETEFMDNYEVQTYQAMGEYDIDCPDGIENWVYIYLKDGDDETMIIGLDLHRDTWDFM